MGKRLEGAMRRRIKTLRAKSKLDGAHVQEMVAVITGITRGMARLEELVPDDPFLVAVVEVLQLQARRLDAAEQREVPRSRRAKTG